MEAKLLLIIAALFMQMFFSSPSWAKPDFGNPTSEYAYLRKGIADHLSERDKDRYRSIKKSMNQHRFSKLRQKIVSVLDFTAAHPGAVCHDKGIGSGKKGTVNSKDFKNVQVGLSCTYGKNGSKTKTFKNIMTTDLNKVLDKNMKTPVEIYEAREDEFKRSKREGPRGRLADRETASNKDQQNSNKKDSIKNSKESYSPYNQYINDYVVERQREPANGKSISFSKESTWVKKYEVAPISKPSQDKSGVQYSEASENP